MKKLLSRVPDDKMVEAALKATRAASWSNVAVWEAMWLAAPSLPEPGEVEKDAREIALWLEKRGDTDEQIAVLNAADLIAAQRAENERLLKIIERLAEQQAIPDDWWKHELDAAKGKP